MNEAIKEALLEHGYSLYQKEWIEETATEGYEQMIQNIKENYRPKGDCPWRADAAA